MKRCLDTDDTKKKTIFREIMDTAKRKKNEILRAHSLHIHSSLVMRDAILQDGIIQNNWNYLEFSKST